MVHEWTKLQQVPGEFASGMWLMQDGSILVNLFNGTTLQALYPDSKSSYANGSWVDAGNFLLEKILFASAVLSDGRLISCGGEYSGSGLPETETNFCEIYDFPTNTAIAVTPPTGWPSIGDSPSVVLGDGTFMLGNTQGMGQQVALLDAATLTWTFGGGDSDNEQGYVLLQTGDVLTANVYTLTSQRYDAALQKFVPDAPVPVALGSNSEIGPGICLMDGRVVWFGSTGHTCIYTPGGAGKSGSWVQVSDMPVLKGDQLIATDSCAILESNGRVFLVSYGTNVGVVFLEYDPVKDTFTVVPPGADGPLSTNRESVRMLLLPNGNGLVALQLVDNSAGWYEVTFDTSHSTSWAPTITSFPATVKTGETVTLEGTQLCGLSECQHFGDDNQQAEHYPMVRFVSATGDIQYARAHDVTTRSIAPGQSGAVSVDVPGWIPVGTYCAEVVAMGIPSACVTVKIGPRLPSIIAAIVAALFGGVTRDGGGFAVIKGVRIPVDPGPLQRVFVGLSDSLQDTLVGASIGHLASFLNNAAAGAAIQAIVGRLDTLGTEVKPAPAAGSSSRELPVWGAIGLCALFFVLGVLAALLVTKGL